MRSLNGLFSVRPSLLMFGRPVYSGFPCFNPGGGHCQISSHAAQITIARVTPIATTEMAIITNQAHMTATEAQLSVPKIRFDNNGDEVRRGPAAMRYGLRAGWRDGSERLCQETDESLTRCNKRHTSSGSGVSALRPRRQYGRRTRDESTRSIFRRSRSAKASLGQWACRGCRWPVIGG